MTSSLPRQNIQAGYGARHYVLTGHVQGVGFRPFVYHLARTHHISGWVENRIGQVFIHAEGSVENLQVFECALIEQAPYPAKPQMIESQTAELGHFQAFRIHDSSTATSSSIRVPTDLPLCEACLKELNDSADRRFHYPFINCTQCGPRYTLIRQLPYDRVNTTMADFKLCPDCQREYGNIHDRRFHAEPIACPHCGPQLRYQHAQGEVHDDQQALAACIEDLRLGKIVAVKGIGGYHLMCDAGDDAAVQRLRERKQRPHKPLAVMMNAAQFSSYADADTSQWQLLHGPIHPIVLVNKRPSSGLSQHIAPGLQDIGVMLPYSPLHYLLIELFGAPLLATSANISGEPVLTHGQEVTLRLNKVADSFLHHNRHIQRPVDDSVYRIIQHKPRPLRLGRGIAPLELTLPFQLQEPLLAVGGHMKNTIALAWDDRIVISPHIGVLDTLRSQQVFEQTISDLQALYQVEAKQLVCDAHPGYASTRRAKASGMPVHQVYHHHAHAACLSGEFPKEEYWLVFCWDGVGLGTDGTLWGGEALLGNAGHWQRVASMQSFHLPGSEKVSREPWRSAAALCWEASYAWHSGQADAALLHQAWQKKVNCPLTTSVGRLFDAAAALCGLVTHSSHEAQGPMLLEALASHGQGHTMDLPLQQDTQGVWRTDWSPLLPMLTDNTINVSDRARCFHESLAQALLQQALLIREDRKDFAIGLGGGAFQNRLLTERVFQLLEANGFRCYLPEQVPVNDGGLCYGQVMEYHASQSETPQ